MKGRQLVMQKIFHTLSFVYEWEKSKEKGRPMNMQMLLLLVVA